jgi:hypothetical protein
MNSKKIIAILAASLFAGVAFAQPKPATPAAPAKPPVDPKVAACRTGLAAANKDLMESMAKARAAGNIDAKEQAEFNRMDAATKQHFAMMSKDGLTLAECETTAKELAVEKAKVVAMGATKAAPGQAVGDPKVMECRKANTAAHKEVLDMYNKAKAGGKIDPKEAQAFAAMDGNLKKHAAVLAKDGLTLAECSAISADLAREKAAVAKMAK